MFVMRETAKSKQTHMIGDELVNLWHKVFVPVDSWKCTSVNASVISKIIDKMSCALINDSFHPQLPCSEVNVFDL